MQRILLLVAATLFLAPAAGAAPGVLEINQACAVNTGCFSGDAAGFPVQITEPGSYLLTSNLVVPDANSRGIEVTAPSVGIDLGGFEIVTAACLGATSDCTPPTGGGGYGIIVPSAGGYRGVSVKNGGIAGFSQRAVDVGDQAEITNLRVRWNTSHGIYGRTGATISGNSAYENGGIGIHGLEGSTIAGNRAYGNGSVGINAPNGGVTISDNTIYENGGSGISAGSGTTISGNTAYGNGGVGIYATNGSAVLGNTTRDNTGFGLSLSGSGADAPGYAGNVISENSSGSVTGTGVEFGTNLCNGNTTCP